MGIYGSGKSTLVRLINRLIEPTAGQVLINGARRCSSRLRSHRIGMVFQHMTLLQHRTMPTYREIMQLAGICSTNAASKFVTRQLIQQDPTGQLLSSRSFSDLRMLGSVDAGIPSPA